MIPDFNVNLPNLIASILWSSIIILFRSIFNWAGILFNLEFENLKLSWPVPSFKNCQIKLLLRKLKLEPASTCSCSLKHSHFGFEVTSCLIRHLQKLKIVDCNLSLEKTVLRNFVPFYLFHFRNQQCKIDVYLDIQLQSQ